MNISDIISRLTKKQQQLISNILMVGMLFTILYAMLSIIFQFRMNLFKFLKSSMFLYVILSIIFLYVAWDVFTKLSKKKGKRRKVKVKHNIKKKPTSTPHGSWKCPNCNTFVVGDTCPDCGCRYE